MHTGRDIVNMLNCHKGEHPLFRSFGLSGVTDQAGRIQKAQITQETARWYPQVRSVEISISGDTYEVRISEVE